VLLDTFHFHGGGSTLEDLQDTPAGQIVLVHLTDCLDFPREQLTDLHRVFPGLGMLPLGEIRSILTGNGYQGFYCLEVSNEEYWQGDPLTVACAGIKAWRELR
jgi:2-keto-myo-inositol isomerase